MPPRALAALAVALAAGCAVLPAADDTDGLTRSGEIDASLKATPSRPSYRPGEPVSVHVALTNEGALPLSCLMPCGEVASGATVLGPDGTVQEVRALPVPEPPGAPAHWKPLARWESAERDIPLNGRFFLSDPGRYQFRVVARGRQGWLDRLHPRFGDLETTVRFEVVASTGL